MISLPGLLTSKHHHFGLSLGRNSLRAVELEKSGKVRAALEIKLPDGMFEAGVLTNKDAFLSALRKLLTSGKFTSLYVSVCFSEVYAFSREYALPKIEQEDIHEAVSWHVKDLFPYPEDEIYFDWKLIGETEKEYKVIVVAVQKNILDPIVETLINVGLKPVRIEPGASAISRLLKLKPDQNALVTEINQVGAYVTLVAGEKSLFTTVVNLTPQDTPATYIQNIAQTLTEVATYYRQRELIKDATPQVILTGELASDQWKNEAAAYIKYPMAVLKAPIPSPAFNKAYAAAINSTITAQESESINLLPEEIKLRYEKERTHAFYRSLTVRTTAITAILSVFSLVLFLVITFERQTLESQVKTKTEKTKVQRVETQSLLSLNANAQSIVELAPRRITPKDKLLIIQSLLPETVIVTEWKYEDAQLLYTLNGIAESREDLLLFKAKLEQSGEFAHINLPLDSLEAPVNVRFTISFVSL